MKHLKWLIITLSFFYLQACATTSPTITSDKHIALGQSKREIDLYFSKQNNNSGHWQEKLLFEKVSGEKLERIYLYRWRQERLFMWRLPGIPSYKLGFLDDMLITQKIWAANQNSDISPKCKAAIIQNRKDEIYLNC